MARIDGEGDELGHANLLNVGIGREGLLDVPHVGTAAGEDDAAQQLVVVLVGDLLAHVEDDLGETALDDVDELTALDRTLGVDAVLERVVDVINVSIGRAVFQLHLLGFALLHAQRGNVLGDIVDTDRNDGQMAHHVLPEHGDGGSVGAEVYEDAARALLGLGEHYVGQFEGSQIHLDHLDAGHLEALVQLLEERLALKNVQEVALQARGGNAHGVELKLGVDAILLFGNVDDLLVGILHVTVLVHEFAHHLLSNLGIGGQVDDLGVAHAAHRLSAHAYEDLADVGLELPLELLDNGGEALGCLVDVVDHALAYERRRVFAGQRHDTDAAVGLLLPCDAGHLR